MTSVEFLKGCSFDTFNCYVFCRYSHTIGYLNDISIVARCPLWYLSQQFLNLITFFDYYFRRPHAETALYPTGTLAKFYSMIHISFSGPTRETTASPPNFPSSQNTIVERYLFSLGQQRQLQGCGSKLI